MVKRVTKKKRKISSKSRGRASSTRKKTTSRRRKRKSNGSGRRWILHLGLIATLVIAAWVLWLDHSVQQQFEDHGWTLPARVFARPLDLFADKKIDLRDVLEELKILGYRRVSSAKNSGEFSASDRVINLVTRGFTFIDGQEPAQKLSLRFSSKKLVSLQDLSSAQPIALARLEPVEIAKIFPKNHEDRVIVTLDQVPAFLIKALIATEDRRFYQHHGIDPKGIARAILSNLKAMKIKEGASTLTQQLVKNMFLTDERTFWRKINEQIMALSLEYHYEKDDILSAYLNEVYLGQDNNRAIHGFGLAAEYFFAAPLDELRIDQMAMLVGMVKGPSYYDPRRHPERAKNRRDLILNTMQQLDLISKEEKMLALAAKLDIKPRRSLSRSRYPAFTELVRQQLVKDYAEQDLRNEGLRIFTTLDPIRQKKAEKALKNRIDNLEKQKKLDIGQLQGAVIISDIRSGEIQAIVGGRDDQKGSYNHALNSPRHIGSLIKPVVYLHALEKGRTLASILKDEPIAWQDKRNNVWRPQNYDKIFHGDVPLLSALQHSYNAATVWLGKQLGPSSIVDRLYSLGLDSNHSIPAYPSVLLGAVSLTPIEINRIYQTIANDGFDVPPRTIRSVLTKDNQPLQRFRLKVERVIDENSSYLIKYAMTEVVRAGTAKAAAAVLPNVLPLAGKTGTTDQLRDSWFSGFDQKTLAVVWLGRDDNKSAGLTGASGALNVWIDLAKSLDFTPIDLIPPKNIKWYWLNSQTGNQIEKDCPAAQAIPFIIGTEPHKRESCNNRNSKSSSQPKKKQSIKGLFEGWLN